MNGASPTVTITSGSGATGGLEGIARAVRAAPRSRRRSPARTCRRRATRSRRARRARSSSRTSIRARANQPSGPLFGVQFSQLSCSDVNQRASAGHDRARSARRSASRRIRAGCRCTRTAPWSAASASSPTASYALDLDIIGHRHRRRRADRGRRRDRLRGARRPARQPDHRRRPHAALRRQRSDHEQSGDGAAVRVDQRHRRRAGQRDRLRRQPDRRRHRVRHARVRLPRRRESRVRRDAAPTCWSMRPTCRAIRRWPASDGLLTQSEVTQMLKSALDVAEPRARADPAAAGIGGAGHGRSSSTPTASSWASCARPMRRCSAPTSPCRRRAPRRSSRASTAAAQLLALPPANYPDAARVVVDRRLRDGDARVPHRSDRARQRHRVQQSRDRQPRAAVFSRRHRRNGQRPAVEAAAARGACSTTGCSSISCSTSSSRRSCGDHGRRLHRRRDAAATASRSSPAACRSIAATSSSARSASRATASTRTTWSRSSGSPTPARRSATAIGNAPAGRARRQHRAAGHRHAAALRELSAGAVQRQHRAECLRRHLSERHSLVAAALAAIACAIVLGAGACAAALGAGGAPARLPRRGPIPRSRRCRRTDATASRCSPQRSTSTPTPDANSHGDRAAAAGRARRGGRAQAASWYRIELVRRPRRLDPTMSVGRRRPNFSVDAAPGARARAARHRARRTGRRRRAARGSRGAAESLPDDRIVQQRPMGRPLEPIIPEIDPTQVPPPPPLLPRETVPVPDRWRLADQLGARPPALVRPVQPEHAQGRPAGLRRRLVLQPRRRSPTRCSRRASCPTADRRAVDASARSRTTSSAAASSRSSSRT